MLLLTPAACLISTDEAEQTALKYKEQNESKDIYGPYTYLNSPYYLVDYKPADDANYTNGVIIIDAETGKVVKDKEIVEKIALTHYIFFGGYSREWIESYEMDSAYYKTREGIMNENIKTIKESIKVMNNTTKLDNYLTITEVMKETYSDLSVCRDKQVDVAKKINAGEASYENAVIVVALKKEFITLTETFLENMKEYRKQVNVYYDLGNTMGYNSDRYSWENGRERELAHIDNLVEAMTEDYEYDKTYIETSVEYADYLVAVYDQKLKKYGDPETPGFGIFFAVAAILVGSVLIKRKE